MSPNVTPALGAAILRASALSAFVPHVIVHAGLAPCARDSQQQSRRVPWALEKQLREQGTSIVFLDSQADLNRPEVSVGFDDYDFPLARSRWAGPVYLAGPLNDPLVEIGRWNFPRGMSAGGRASHPDSSSLTLRITSPWALNDRSGRFHTLIWAPQEYRPKDPVWRSESDLEDSVGPPYAIAAWTPHPSPAFLFTGHAFCDGALGQADNALVVDRLMAAIEALHAKRQMMKAAPVAQALGETRMTKSRHILPFHALDPQSFERLCLWLVELEGFASPEHTGFAGQDGGRDIIGLKVRAGNSERWSFQCKRVGSVTLSELRAEVDKVVISSAAGESIHGVVFIITCAVSARIRDTLRPYASQRGLECEFWALSELDRRVKRHPEILKEFFTG